MMPERLKTYRALLSYTVMYDGFIPVMKHRKLIGTNLLYMVQKRSKMHLIKKRSGIACSRFSAPSPPRLKFILPGIKTTSIQNYRCLKILQDLNRLHGNI